jgi:hypothetical protein
MITNSEPAKKVAWYPLLLLESINRITGGFWFLYGQCSESGNMRLIHYILHIIWNKLFLRFHLYLSTVYNFTALWKKQKNICLFNYFLKMKQTHETTMLTPCLLLCPPLQFEIGTRWPIFTKSENTMSLEATTNFLQTVVTTGWMNTFVGRRHEMMYSNRSSKLSNSYIEHNNMTAVWNPNFAFNLMLINNETLELLMFIRQELNMMMQNFEGMSTKFCNFLYIDTICI